jgi:hypothetical protein
MDASRPQVAIEDGAQAAPVDRFKDRTVRVRRADSWRFMGGCGTRQRDAKRDTSTRASLSSSSERTILIFR